MQIIENVIYETLGHVYTYGVDVMMIILHMQKRKIFFSQLKVVELLAL
jgi:hypothetical protein